jgi:membrane protein DedA with SNARE-associated domain
MEKLIDIMTHFSDPEFIARYSEYLLIIVFLYSFIEVVFPPIPGDALLILSGSISEYAGLNPVWILAVAFAGTFSASYLLYNLGFRMERRILHSPRFSSLLDTKSFIKIEKVLNRSGFWLILFSRFVPVVRSGIILAAGMVNLDKRKSLAALALSVLGSTSLFILGGRYLGKRLEIILRFWNSRFRTILGTAGIILLLYLIITKAAEFLRKKRDLRKENDQ